MTTTDIFHTTYDDVPYGSYAFSQSHPDRLATLGHIFGLSPTPITNCRVLELGCASGGNLIPMAFNLPNSEFVGVDLSQKQVDAGREAIIALGLTNIRIEHASILDITDDWGEFDYIICHGVFSWVEKEVQDKILAIAASNLSNQGIAYISYNTYPGWHMREMIRHMMRFHADRFEESGERIEQARALLSFLADAVPADSGAYGQWLHSELDLIKQCTDWYIYHEHLEAVNAPTYFHQFIERAEANRLQFLAEADYSVMLTGSFPREVAQTLEQISPDIIHLEQYMDFVRNRLFRQTLLCRRELALRRALNPASLENLLVCANALPDASSFDYSPGISVKFRARDGATISTDAPISKAALVILRERWPCALDVDSLFQEALRRTTPDLPIAEREGQRRCLLEALFQGFLAKIVEPRVWQPPIVIGYGERPMVNAFAAYQAGKGGFATNYRHEAVNLDLFSRELIAAMDGSRSVAELVADMVEKCGAGTIARTASAGQYPKTVAISTAITINEKPAAFATNTSAPHATITDPTPMKDIATIRLR